MMLSRRSSLKVLAIVPLIAFPQKLVAAGDLSLADIGKRYGIFYFFASSCAACKIQSPIMYRLRQQGLPIFAISQDEGPDPFFPDYRIDGGRGERMGVSKSVTPTFVAFDSVTKQTIILGSGVIEEAQLTRAMVEIANTYGR
jgi:conjugal transfer pilus assembly protein TraF